MHHIDHVFGPYSLTNLFKDLLGYSLTYFIKGTALYLIDTYLQYPSSRVCVSGEFSKYVSSELVTTRIDNILMDHCSIELTSTHLVSFFLLIPLSHICRWSETLYGLWSFKRWRVSSNNEQNCVSVSEQQMLTSKVQWNEVKIYFFLAASTHVAIISITSPSHWGM